MSVLKGEKIEELATLTQTRQLLFSENGENKTLFDEEYAAAFSKGLSEGEKIGYARGIAETKEMILLLQTLSRKLMDHRKRLLDQLKPEIVEFAIAVCEKVIRKELSQPEGLVRLLNSLLKLPNPNAKSDSLNVILSPEDLHMIEQSLSQIHYNKNEISELNFLSDPLIRRGDCRIEGESGLLNYSIARELADLSAKVLLR